MNKATTATATAHSTSTTASTAPKPLQAPTLLGDKNVGLDESAVEAQAGLEPQEQSQEASWQVREEAPTYQHAPTETPGLDKETFETEVSQNQP